MANALSFGGLVLAAVDLARRYDTDTLRATRYEHVIADFVEMTRNNEGDLTFNAAEEIFAKYALPTAHITELLKGL